VAAKTSARVRTDAPAFKRAGGLAVVSGASRADGDSSLDRLVYERVRLG